MLTENMNRNRSRDVFKYRTVLYVNVIGRKEQPKKIKLLNANRSEEIRPSMSSAVELGTMQNWIDRCSLFNVCDEKAHQIQ
jgi:hypothetical protein